MKVKDRRRELLKDREFKKEYDALEPKGEYLDDLADLFPWLPRGQYRRVAENPLTKT